MQLLEKLLTLLLQHSWHAEGFRLTTLLCMLSTTIQIYLTYSTARAAGLLCRSQVST